jgi:AraC-like DNA-binding protein
VTHLSRGFVFPAAIDRFPPARLKDLVMACGGTFTFTDPQSYQAAVPAHWEILVTRNGDFQSELTQVELPRLWLQRAREGLPRVVRSVVSVERPPIFFLTDADQPAMHHSGMEVSFGELVAVGSGSEHHHRTEAPCQWATMSLTRDDLAATWRALVGCDLIVPSITSRFRPGLPLMLRLINLHKAAGQLTKGAAGISVQPARALEQAILHALVMCLAEGIPEEVDSSGHRHLAIVALFEEMLAANHDQPLYLAEICAAIGVSERTFRFICQEHLGMGPIRYLTLRRMHLAQQALILADPTKSTVTQIATEFGFWELGRFSVEYRALFGEAPSASLRRPPEHLRKSSNDPFAFADAEFA